jgi:hypothetical protein
MNSSEQNFKLKSKHINLKENQLFMLMKVDFLMKVHGHTDIQKLERDVLVNLTGEPKAEPMPLVH